MTPDESKAKCKRNRDNWKARAIAAEKSRDEWRSVAQKLFECERLWVESFADEDLVDKEDHTAMRSYRALVERENAQGEAQPPAK